MDPDLILILEDNSERIAAFERVVTTLRRPTELRVWRDAHSFREEVELSLPRAVLISLDHDLNPSPGATRDPGTGLDAAQFLADYLPVCPVLIHSSNSDRAWSMHNELRFAGWTVERIGPWNDTHWIHSQWRGRSEELLAKTTNTHRTRIPADHASRIGRVALSLAGIGLGDSIGELCAYQAHAAPQRLSNDDLPSGPWLHTDDTEMALSICETLRIHGFIEPDALARRFSRRFERDPDRGYGKMTRIQLREVLAGSDWRTEARRAFSGQGSMGNGAAMRAAPVGAYFGSALPDVVEAARHSALVTHTHADGVAGAVAVALAAALAPRLNQGVQGRLEFWDAMLTHTPEGLVRQGLELAARIPVDADPDAAAGMLGNGSQVTAPDTVPYALWCATRHATDFRGALAAAIQTGGDCDTNAAIVGGIVTQVVGWEGIPPHWLAAREKVLFPSP